MKVETIKNKDGETLTTKEGIELQRFMFEEGDMFIPVHNKPLIREKEVETDNGKRILKDYKLKCRIKDKNGNIIKNNRGEEEIFVDLTPTQYEQFMKKIAMKEKELGEFYANQHIWIAYKYRNNFGEFIGITIKNKQPRPKTFEDFEN